MDFKSVSARLREGEYQYDLAKTIASFQLELYFPDVKDITARLYGEEKVNDIRFIRKIQTILKKMEKSGIIQILPKERPWDLQRYAILSYKFRDADKRDVILASDQQIKQAKEKIHELTQQEKSGWHKNAVLLLILTAIISGSYLLSIWALTQPIINLLIFIPAFSITVAFSMLFGKVLSENYSLNKSNNGLR
ncbi:MAG: hypothetical protein QXX59_02910 [Candidatus Bathyarchaeia archaeon]